MNLAEIIQLQKDVGTTPDGYWGPKSMSACQAYLRKLAPRKNPWPDTTQAALTAFYGKPGDESRLVNLPVEGLGLKYGGKAVKTVRCHQRVADSLLVVLCMLQQTHPGILAKFDGCYNNRPMRGGSLPSLHARGAASDWNQARNGLTMPWPVRADMPLVVIEAFVRQGWKPLATTIWRDAMHFEATS